LAREQNMGRLGNGLLPTAGRKPDGDKTIHTLRTRGESCRHFAASTTFLRRPPLCGEKTCATIGKYDAAVLGIPFDSARPIGPRDSLRDRKASGHLGRLHASTRPILQLRVSASNLARIPDGPGGRRAGGRVFFPRSREILEKSFGPGYPRGGRHVLSAGARCR